MGSQKIRGWIYILVGGCVFLFGCIFLNFALGTVTPLQRTLALLCTAVSYALCGACIWLRFLSEDKDPNYFLYDGMKKQNLAIEQLNFQRINDKMNAFLTRQSQGEAQLWSDGFLETSCHYGRGGIFRPLVAYKMLYDLAEKDTDAGWRCFTAARNETVAFLCASIAKSGDGEMAKVLQYLKVTYPSDTTALRSYLIGNRNYLKLRMRKFIVEHIDWFY